MMDSGMHIQMMKVHGLTGSSRPRNSGRFSLAIILNQIPWDEMSQMVSSIRRINQEGWRARPAPARVEVPAGRNGLAAPRSPWQPGAHLRPIARLSAPAHQGIGESSLQILSGGKYFRVTSPPVCNLVTPRLAQRLGDILDTFAVQAGFTSQGPLQVKTDLATNPGNGKSIDILAIGGQGIGQWKSDFDAAIRDIKRVRDPDKQNASLRRLAKLNLGYRLYKTFLSEEGIWKIEDGVVQLFGPWTPELGPWRRLKYETPDQSQLRVMREQENFFRTFRDRIHVAVE